MKKLLVISVSLVLFVAGCAEDRIEAGDIPFGVDFALPKGEPIFVDGVNSRLRVKVLNTTDSRCPANVLCIWEGNYGADIEISDATQSVELSLCNLFCGSTYREKDSVSFELNETEYMVILKDLQPYPGTTESDQPRTVTLEILKQD